MATCDCALYPALELCRKAIDERIRASKKLRKRLDLIAEHPAGEHRLYRCPLCATHWQRSLAWNWGSKEYLFVVPAIDPELWAQLPYVKPDELLIFAAVIEPFVELQTSESSTDVCRSEGCALPTVKMSVFCLHHHIVNLQSARLLPQDPTGRWFPPYKREGFAIP